MEWKIAKAHINKQNAILSKNPLNFKQYLACYLKGREIPN